MIHAVARRWLKVVDPTALTARETLRHALGLGDRVEGVARSEIFAFGWEGDPGARGILERLARETNLLRNPNKHHLEIAVGDEALRPRGNVWVLVARPGQGSALGETLARRRLVPGVPPRTGRGTLWELTLDGEPASRGDLARSLAVVRGRREGILSNPHVEDARVFESVPGAAAVAAFFGVAPPSPVT